jgi:4-amino-4-deoxy-L-arabinose transferase-like glycosyltransferase
MPQLLARPSSATEPVALERVGRKWVWLVFACAALFRVTALSSDAYTRLDWSAGLLTDEGFYIHNARNAALFGNPRTDEFNNMLLSPGLHAVQTAVFRVFGVGVVQARAISVASSLLMLSLLWAALRRVFGEKVGLTAVAFLALDHVNLLYNRMALMDTPAAMLAAGAFYAFVRGLEFERTKGPTKRELGWLALSGVLLGLMVTNRSLTAYIVPAPFVGLWAARAGWKSILSALAGLGAVVIAYFVLWYSPNRAEISAMTYYYRTTQLQPSSLSHWLENVRQAFFGDFRGLSPYLVRHSPALYLLALAGVVAGCRQALKRGADGSSGANVGAVACLVAWFVLGWATLASISYSPSRYYVTLYPAAAALASLVLWRLVSRVESGQPLSGYIKVIVPGLAAFAVYHGLLATLHYRGPFGPEATTTLCSLSAASAGGLVVLFWPRLSALITHRQAWIAPVCLGAWLLVNGAWLGDWAARLDYSQVRFSHWLAENLPPDSVIIGDLAPGLTMETKFKAIHVQPGLANYDQPVEQFATAPRYVAILAGRWKEKYWSERYPEIIDSSRLLKSARVLRWDVGVYSVDSHPGIH